MNATVYTSNGRTLGFALKSTDCIVAQGEVLDRIGHHHFVDWSSSGFLADKPCVYGEVEKVPCSDHPQQLTLIQTRWESSPIRVLLCTEHLASWAEPLGWVVAGPSRA
ncbi:hypothetical protein ACFVGM_09135 [Kitasatospora purpeofusca]|uniref:hypothetical protein n=1 Tax=Kitasatospora purpeofusca TaxID=67352 RepID=UPI003695FDFF